MIELTWNDIDDRATAEAVEIGNNRTLGSVVRAYPIPRGGIPAAQAVQAHCKSLCLKLVEKPGCADIYIDDIIDSGNTRMRMFRQYGEKPFYALVDKLSGRDSGGWYSFPWERMGGEGSGIQDAVTRFFQFIGEDSEREGLKETPARVERSYGELFAGYKQSPKDLLKVFVDDSSDQMVVVKNIEFYSTCEHHLLPFFGTAHIGYLPDGKVVGVSKLVRILEVFARRLQIQERLTEQVTKTLMEHLNPLGAACVIQAQHFCMIGRGVKKQGSVMVTSSLKGVFQEPDVKREFLAMLV